MPNLRSPGWLSSCGPRPPKKAISNWSSGATSIIRTTEDELPVLKRLVDEAHQAGLTAVELLDADQTPTIIPCATGPSSVRCGTRFQAGGIWINDHIPIISEMPHGGYKASGSGKDMSTYSFDEYTNIKKHVMSDITGNAHKGWHDTVFGGE